MPKGKSMQEEVVTTPIDLAQFGLTGIFNCRGTIVSQRLAGRRVLFLFGERHNVMPFIRDNLLNALELDKLGALSCVGVEGHPTGDFPGADTTRTFETLRVALPDEEEIIEEMLRRFGRRRNFYFWKILTLLRPSLIIESVDDPDLCARASDLEWQFLDRRREAIAWVLEKSDLFEHDNPDKKRTAAEKAIIQAQLEWAEHEVNLQRDAIFLQKLEALWGKTGTDRASVLNAGCSHQFRIARQLPDEWSYYHIEQP
jgi:hypothetical protein